MAYLLVASSLSWAPFVALLGAEEIRLSVVHEQTSKQKAETLHCQPPGTLSYLKFQVNKMPMDRIGRLIILL